LGIRLFAIVAASGATLLAVPAMAEDADYYRGGWRVEAGGPQVYEFVIRGSEVSGIACTHCSDGTTLARVMGTFGPDSGIAFTVRHLALDGALVSTDRLQAKLDGGKLHVTGTRGADGAAVDLVAIKDPRGPTPGGGVQTMLPPGSPPVAIVRPGGGAGGGPPPAYLQPAPWRQVSAADLLGVWVGFGFGLTKQYFLIRRDGDQLFGLACGPCDNPYTMGALDHFAFAGDTVRFDIEHQDWGEGTRVPFVRHVSAHIAMNELRMDARRDDSPDHPGIVASLVGPISLEATRGNAIGE
jgi:hypothetical protein